MPALIPILFGALFTLAVAWMLGNICLYRLPVPGVIALAVGAAVESCIVFLLLVAGAGNRTSFMLLGLVVAAVFVGQARGLRRPLRPPTSQPADRITTYLSAAILACYAALYLINALAPELEPDAIAYHLGLTSEYVRRGAFPNRVGFFEMVPQGLEMLFVPAFAFGRHSAARLVHCAFLLASVPLMLHIARRLLLPESVALAAAVLYFCSPLAGVTGTSAYTDAAGVFFVLAAFYLLLVWRDTRDARYLVPAGIAAGMCYAIKIPGALVVMLAVLFVVAVEHAISPRSLALLCGAALAVMAPWLLRCAVMTGNPFAPLFNRFFPNPFFHLSMERELAAALGSFGGVPAWRIPYEIILGGRFSGILGPAFFALPLGLLALRRRPGRLCWLAALLLALPWFRNTGARFLMPALPFLALALAMPLPRAALWLCVAVQAVGCWPQVFALYQPRYAWRLERIPLRAALRIQPEDDYLSSLSGGYRVARMVEDHTKPGERIFALTAVPAAYIDREVLEYWHSAQADNLRDALHAALRRDESMFDVTVSWPTRALLGIRMRMSRDFPMEWRINEIALFNGAARIAGGPLWQIHAWPNDWEIPLAFDGNPATRWRGRQPIRAGMFAEIVIEPAQILNRLVLTSPTPNYGITPEFYARDTEGWQYLPNQKVTQLGKPDWRADATRAVAGAGFRYILAEIGDEGNGLFGAAMSGHEAEWGLEKVAASGAVVLFRIK